MKADEFARANQSGREKRSKKLVSTILHWDERAEGGERRGDTLLLLPTWLVNMWRERHRTRGKHDCPLSSLITWDERVSHLKRESMTRGEKHLNSYPVVGTCASSRRRWHKERSCGRQDCQPIGRMHQCSYPYVFYSLRGKFHRTTRVSNIFNSRIGEITFYRWNGVLYKMIQSNKKCISSEWLSCTRCGCTHRKYKSFFYGLFKLNYRLMHHTSIDSFQLHCGR